MANWEYSNKVFSVPFFLFEDQFQREDRPAKDRHAKQLSADATGFDCQVFFYYNHVSFQSPTRRQVIELDLDVSPGRLSGHPTSPMIIAQEIKTEESKQMWLEAKEGTYEQERAARELHHKDADRLELLKAQRRRERLLNSKANGKARRMDTTHQAVGDVSQRACGDRIHRAEIDQAMQRGHIAERQYRRALEEAEEWASYEGC